MSHQSLLLFTAIAALLLAGCKQATQSPRDACLIAALQQPDLDNGVAAFTKMDGTTGLVSTTWRGRLRLARGYRYPAASLTKPRLAYVIKSLINTGMLDLDTPAPSLLPNYELNRPGIPGGSNL